MESAKPRLRDKFQVPETHGVLKFKLKPGQVFTIGNSIIRIERSTPSQVDLLIVSPKELPVSRSERS